MTFISANGPDHLQKTNDVIPIFADDMQCLYGAEWSALQKFRSAERFYYSAPAFCGAQSGVRSDTPERGAERTPDKTGAVQTLMIWHLILWLKHPFVIYHWL